MYTDYCEVLHLYIRWFLIYIVGQSYVHQLLWGLTLAHKMVPYIVSYVLLCLYTDHCRVFSHKIWSLIYDVSYVLLWVKLMYTDYWGVSLLYIRRCRGSGGFRAARLPGRRQARGARQAYGWRRIRPLPLTVELQTVLPSENSAPSSHKQYSGKQ